MVALLTENDNKLLDKLKAGFKRTIKCDSNNLNYLNDRTFSKINRLFVLSLKNEDDRTSFSNYYTPSVEIKDFNISVDSKCFFDIL